MPDFRKFRKQHPVFSYNDYSIKVTKDEIILSFSFEFDKFCRFNPEIRIKTDNLKIVNDPCSDLAREIVFSLGMVEAVSYWKAACSKTVRVNCGSLSAADKLWFKKLWFNGMEEFFYRNEIDASFEKFVSIEADENKKPVAYNFKSAGLSLIPLGGGKHSAVTLELLRENKAKNMLLTINDKPARTQCAEAAGYGEDKIVKVYRTIDKSLPGLNNRGYLNGPTPFPAIVAFLGYYCAYLIGAEDFVLSSKSCAKTVGAAINHRYAKSYEFEEDFDEYSARNFGLGIRYYSILRAFNEVQIAKQFAAHKEYHHIFKSCKIGSKTNTWCCSCAKCLYVYIILHAFLDRKEMLDIFGCDMLVKTALTQEFDALCGLSEVKPFELIGLADEVCAALDVIAGKYDARKPALLERYLANREKLPHTAEKALLGEFNEAHNIPDSLMPRIKEMYRYVSTTD